MFVTHEIAKKLNRLGFNTSCTSFYTGNINNEDVEFFHDAEKSNSQIRDDIQSLSWLPVDARIELMHNCTICAPDLDTVIDWLERYKGLIITFDFDQTTYPKWCYKITKYENDIYENITKVNEFGLYRDKNDCKLDAIIEALNDL